MKLRTLKATLPLLAVLCAGLAPSPVRAWAGGGHLGLNLDDGDIHIGGDLLFPLADVSPNVRLSIWPSAAFVFHQHGRGGLLLGGDLPFEFLIDNSAAVPFVGPGLALAIGNDDAQLRLNVIGGVFINTGGPVRPFGELVLRFVGGTTVDLLFGVLFEV
jgi:hypothetical protein